MWLVSKIKKSLYQKHWRTKNKSNSTDALNVFPIEQVHVGRYTYGGIYALIFDKSSILKIGNYCSIAPHVSFMLSADHYSNHISTFPLKVKVLGQDLEGVSKGDIIVDDDVWIGYGATILSGVHIGQGAVIAAGAVVSHDVPPYAIVGGVPAKVIKYRFEPEMINELLKVDYGKLSKEDIEKHIDDLYQPLKFTSQLDWMPKK